MENPLATSVTFSQMENLDRFMFGWLDYALFILLLLISVLIGVYFGFFSKQDSTTEYFLGGKRMGCFPVAMSIIARSVTSLILFLYEHANWKRLMQCHFLPKTREISRTRHSRSFSFN